MVQTAKTRGVTVKMDHKEVMVMLADDLKLVEESIRHNYKSDVAMIPLVSDYLANGGGKRLRPVLVLLSSRLCGYQGEMDITYCTVVEYIHAATLLHDDVVDDSDVRRGRPSANAKFGNQMSVLVGDYLFAKSFSLMASADTPKIVEVVSEATKYLAEGEVLQLVHNGNIEMTESDYMDVIFRKTGALISACCQIGGLLGKATSGQRRALESFGKNIGIAFQIVDDMLDFVADEKTLGKPVGQDFAEGRITAPVIHAYKNASASEKGFLASAAKDGEFAAKNVGEIISLVNKYDSIGYSARLAENYALAGIKELEFFSNDLHGSALAGIADYIVNRNH